MNFNELKATKEALKRSLHELEIIKVACYCCTQYKNTQCTKYAAPPPDDWVRGPIECESWEYDEIPF